MRHHARVIPCGLKTDLGHLNFFLLAEHKEFAVGAVAENIIPRLFLAFYLLAQCVAIEFSVCGKRRHNRGIHSGNVIHLILFTSLSSDTK